MTINNTIISQISKQYKSLFPLTSVNDIILLFHSAIQPYFSEKHKDPKDIYEDVNNFIVEILRKDEYSPVQPIVPSTNRVNIGFLSLLLGYIEFKLTCSSFKSTSSFVHKPKNNECLSQSLSVEVSDYNSCNSNTSSPNIASESSCSSSGISSPLSRKLKRPKRSSSSSCSRSRKRNLSGLSAPDKIMEAKNFDKKIFVNTTDSGVNSDHSSPSLNFLHINLEDILVYYQKIYQRFYNHPKMKSHLDSMKKKSSTSEFSASKEIIKTICDIISSSIVYHKGSEKWNHSQTLFSFINTNTLDGFGLAITVYSICEMFQIRDVWLSLSEEYAWIEIKSSSDNKKIISLDVSRYIYEKSDDICISAKNIKENWIYLKGISVTSRLQPLLPLAAIITSIQSAKDSSLIGFNDIAFNRRTQSTIPEEPNSSGSPNNFPEWITRSSPEKKSSSSQQTLNSQLLSHRMVDLKHRLLWLIASRHLIDFYPVGLSNLADLEENFPTPINAEAIDKILTKTKQDPELAIVNSRENHYRQLMIKYFYKLALDANINVYRNKQVYPYLNMANCCLRQNNLKEALKFWSIAARVVSQYNHGNEDTEVYKELLEIATVILPSISRTAVDNLKFGPSSNENLVEYLSTLNILDDPECFGHIISFIDGLCIWEEDSDVPVLHIGWVDKLMQTLLRFSSKAASFVDINPKKEQKSSKYDLNDNYSNFSTSNALNETLTSSHESSQRTELSKRPNFSCNPMIAYEPDLFVVIQSLGIPVDLVNDDYIYNKPNIISNHDTFLEHIALNCQTKILNINYLLNLEQDDPFIKSDMINNCTQMNQQTLFKSENFEQPQTLPDQDEKKIKIDEEVIIEKIKVENDEVPSEPSNELSKSETLHDQNRICVLIYSEKMKSIASLWKNLSSKQNVSAIKLALTAQINRSNQSSDSSSTHRSTRRSTTLNSSSSNNHSSLNR